MSVFSNTQAINQLVYEVRNPQTNSVQFRKALEKIGEYLALNVLEELSTEESTIRTLTHAEATHRLINETPVLITILRAGLPLNAGVHKVFPKAEVGFLAMSRNEETFKAKVDYVAIPNLENRSVVLSDTMLATGGSLIDAIKIIEQYKPKKIYVIAAIASKPGIERVLQHNGNIKIFSAAVDSVLNHKGHIVPGLGDAGDRCYGQKHTIE
jgi:uracil phosphoribosyltransferase